MSAAPDRSRQARTAMSVWQRLGLSRGGMGRAGAAIADVLPVRVGVPEYPRKDASPIVRPDFDQARQTRAELLRSR